MLSSRRRRRSKSKTKTFFAWLCCSEIHNIQKASLFRIIFHVMRVFLRSQGLSINCSVNKLKKSVRCVCPSTVVDLRNYAKTWQADRQVICNSIRDLHKKIPPPGRSSATHSLPDWLTYFANDIFDRLWKCTNNSLSFMVNCSRWRERDAC